jgi:hypothetical protein
MPLVPARISLSVYDGIGGGGTFLTHLLVSDASTLSAVDAAIAAVAAAFSTVSGAGIKQGEFGLLNTAVAVDPTGAPNVGFGGVFDFNNMANGTIYGLWTPGLKESLVESDGSIDITATVQAAYVAGFSAAVLGGNFTNAQFIPNNVAVDAFSTSRKRRKRVRA